MPLRAAELEVLLTVDDRDVARAEKAVKATGQRIESKPITAKVDGDEKGAKASMDRVQAEAKKLVSQRTVATIDANIDRAERGFVRAKERLDYLDSVKTELDVSADVRRAEANLSKIERQLDALRKSRANVEVDMTTPPPEKFERAGKDAGAELEKGLAGALAAIPIAGGVILAGVAIGKAVASGIQEGLQVEVNQDRLEALTGISPAAARRIALAAGEAYADTFGESIEANMDIGRLAVQFDLIDADSTVRESQRVIEGIAGIADILGEGVEPVTRAVVQLLRTGLAKSADDAFDILAAGQREGVNIAGDYLDTINEFATQFRRLGIDGPTALGLLRQGLQAGARDSDKVADALKELALRAADPGMVDGFNAVGFSWEDLNQRISQGGPEAAAAVDEVLDRLRAIEDPGQRAAAATALFGTQAEDLGDALYALDLTTAADGMDAVAGSAQRMFDTLRDNDATKLEEARRNIDVAVQGIQGALAVAFSDPLEDFATFVSQNRGPLLQFFLDLGNGALDFAETATEGFGEFVSGPMADLVGGLIEIIDWTNGFEGKPQGLVDLQAQMRVFNTDDAVAGIQDLRDQLNGFAEPVVALGYLNDAAGRSANTIAAIGTAADGSQIPLDQLNTGFLLSTEAGQLLDQQLTAATASLRDQLAAAAEAGESQTDLQGRFDTATQAMRDQLVAMGLSQEEAARLVTAYGNVPSVVATTFQANTGEAQTTVDRFIRDNTGRVVQVRVVAGTNNPGLTGVVADLRGRGMIDEFMAAGGIRGGRPVTPLTPMEPIAQMVPPGTWRVVGDRGDVPEAFIPLDGSARSDAIFREAARRMGYELMAAGGITGRAPADSVSVVNNVTVTGVQQEDPRILAEIVGNSVRRVMPLVKR